MVELQMNKSYGVKRSVTPGYTQGKVVLEPKPKTGPILFNGKKLDAAIREINLKKLQDKRGN